MNTEQLRRELTARLEAFGKNDGITVSIVITMLTEAGLLQDAPSDSQLALIPEPKRGAPAPFRSKDPTVKGIEEQLVTKKLMAFIDAYIQASRKRYGPEWKFERDVPVLKRVKDYLRHEQIEHACNMVQVYLQMNEKWFETKGYDLGTFLMNRPKISIALSTGKDSGSPKGIADLLKEQE